MNYKLVKCYPGSPELGYISKPHKVQPETDKNCHYYHHNWFNPEEFPEYWEEVVEKIPLLITADGIKLFLGDKYWYISNLIAHRATVIVRDYPNEPNFYWSTEKAAGNFIKENKPKYSKKDMLDFGKKCREYNLANSESVLLSIGPNTLNNILLDFKK